MPPDGAADPTTLQAGAARRDITPANGGTFFGYVRPDKRAEGVSQRLFAQALVLNDGSRKVALVSADLGAPMVRETVLEHVRPLGFDSDTLVFTCTHTHAGPYDVGEWIAGRIGAAVAAADEARRPAIAGWGTARVEDANRSRSVEAHLANHGQDHQPGTGPPELDPKGPDHTRETELRLLRVDGVDGDHIAAWTLFPVHPTAYTPHNTTFSADLAGVAVRRFAADFPGAGEPPISAYASGALGDLIPVYDEYNMHAVADRAGRNIADGMRRAWLDAGDRLSASVVVDGLAETAVYEGQAVEAGKPVAEEAIYGLPFFGGGQNGPSPYFDAGLEGMRLPSAEADPVHGRKILVDASPVTTDVTVQVLRIGDRLLLACPGEPTVGTERRARDAVAGVAPDGIEDIAGVALANGYNGYFTTPEEYDQQHYEGGHTLFGKYTSVLLWQTHAELTRGLAEDRPGSQEATGTRPAVPDAPVGRDVGEASLTDQPAEAVERMEVVTVEWRGGEAGRDRPLDEPFVLLERDDDGETVATDLDIGFVWRETDDGYIARFEVPRVHPTGTHRFRIRGADYELESHGFEIQPSTALRIRGVRTETIDDGVKLVFEAQHPPPDPERHLRSRPTAPTGGTVTFSAGEGERTASWEEDSGGWSAIVEEPPDDVHVTVPEGGLVDGHGNKSGRPRELTGGEIDDVEWPPHIGSGGDRPPAPDDVVELLASVQELIAEGLDDGVGP